MSAYPQMTWEGNFNIEDPHDTGFSSHTQTDPAFMVLQV